MIATTVMINTTNTNTEKHTLLICFISFCPIASSFLPSFIFANSNKFNSIGLDFCAQKLKLDLQYNTNINGKWKNVFVVETLTYSHRYT